VGIITKNALVTRDLDLLRELGAHGAVSVAVSVTTLDQELARVMEPRTSSPAARLRAIAELSAAGVPVTASVAPIIPGLNDHEIPAILAAACEAGARGAGYVLLRLPTTVREVFLDWLRRHRPNHAAKVESFIRSTRDGKLNNSQWGERQRGRGPMAEQIEQTFRVFAKKYGLDGFHEPLNAADFRPPRPTTGQLNLF
jgi:DNA repair photolyase